MLCKLYCWACRRWRHCGLTFSASAHLLAKAGRPWLRNRIDGLWLLFGGVHSHCRKQWQKESRNRERIKP